jgi:hypothetical protein
MVLGIILEPVSMSWRQWSSGYCTWRFTHFAGFPYLKFQYAIPGTSTCSWVTRWSIRSYMNTNTCLALLNVTFCFKWLILPVTFRFVESLLYYPSVTFTSLSVRFTLTLPPVPVQVPNLPVHFPASWVTLADLPHRNNYQLISLLYPNLTYSSKTHLTPAFSCQLSHFCRYPSVTITSPSALFTLTLLTVHCLELTRAFSC